MQARIIVATVLINVGLVMGLVIPDLKTLLSFDQLLTHIDKVEPSKQDYGQGVLKEDAMAPILSKVSADRIVPNRYIVVFKDGLSTAQVQDHQQWINVHHASMVKDMKIESGQSALLFFNIGESFGGYFGYFNDELIKLIQLNPFVKFIERDAIMQVDEFDIQKEATWGLARLSQRELSPSTDFLYDNDGGEGVTAYVIDTGIKVEHSEFEGRASWGDAVPFPHIKFDGHGHGTHCAGIIGSKTYGVAKKVELVAVGVMNALGSGTTSDIIKGIEFVVNDHKEKVQTKRKGFKGSTVNMSIGGGATDALDLATNAGSKAGLHIAVAAGNDDSDACEYSPARANGPITVGASDNADNKASFSNWGRCVDIFAPGVDILSTFVWSDTVQMSGTSMASPHIAGLLSYFLSLYPDINSEYATGESGLLDPQALKSKVIKYATKGVIQGLTDGQSPNLLAFNGAGGNLTDFWSL
ncbi:hypothetical protein QCA50_017078 [Cerrena zonata]|uniref:Subtilisin-like protein n=2 Tax=Dikarya TaxID=451864 RepID=A0A1E4RD20_9ASCO|nr:subtilisin-like protein [Hyphopichia burtonii NRRL Y-1933]ODV65133.1 subtilisin-like protein [Hyphopichia burtonii NRRL Y-1933]